MIPELMLREIWPLLFASLELRKSCSEALSIFSPEILCFFRTLTLQYLAFLEFSTLKMSQCVSMN